MKPTRAGAEAMPARHAMPDQKKIEKRALLPRQHLRRSALALSSFALLCFASSANTPDGKNRKPSQIGGHFPFEHVLPTKSPCACLVSETVFFGTHARTHFPVAARALNLQRRRRDCDAEPLATARWRPRDIATGDLQLATAGLAVALKLATGAGSYGCFLFPPAP